MSPPDQTALFEKAREVLLAAAPDAWAFYAFGSVVRGDARPDSDLDLAILLPPGRALLQPLQLAARLSEAVGRAVDLVDLRRAGEILRKEVLSDGTAFYVADPDQLLAWEGEAMTEYATHLLRIRHILSDFGETGIGYRR